MWHCIAKYDKDGHLTGAIQTPQYAAVSDLTIHGFTLFRPETFEMDRPIAKNPSTGEWAISILIDNIDVVTKATTIINTAVNSKDMLPILNQQLEKLKCV